MFQLSPGANIHRVRLRWIQHQVVVKEPVMDQFSASSKVINSLAGCHEALQYNVRSSAYAMWAKPKSEIILSAGAT